MYGVQSHKTVQHNCHVCLNNEQTNRIILIKARILNTCVDY